MRIRIRNTSFISSLVIVLLLLLVNGCSIKNKSEADDSLKLSVEARPDTVKLMDISLLQGIWWSSPDDIHATFYVIGDSLYYTEEQHSPYFVELKEDTLIMTRDSVHFKFEIRRITSDSLFLYDKNMNEVISLYKSITKN